MLLKKLSKLSPIDAHTKQYACMMMKKFMALPEAERMKQLEQSKTMCICKNCPSYLGTGETKLLFCGVGKSSLIKEEKGCSCGLCPVVGHIGLTRLYYCMYARFAFIL